MQKLTPNVSVSTLRKDANRPSKKWYSPHFPIVRPDRTTTQTRIVFDASVEREGVSLNYTILPGPRLQKDLNDVLLRFPKYPVALVYDIAECT